MDVFWNLFAISGLDVKHLVDVRFLLDSNELVSSSIKKRFSAYHGRVFLGFFFLDCLNCLILCKNFDWITWIDSQFKISQNDELARFLFVKNWQDMKFCINREYVCHSIIFFSLHYYELKCCGLTVDLWFWYPWLEM